MQGIYFSVWTAMWNKMTFKKVTFMMIIFWTDAEWQHVPRVEIKL